METRFKFSGTGGGLLVKFIVGMLLSMITLGIYLPWFAVNLAKYIYEHTTIVTPQGEVRLQFRGTGGKLFVAMIVGYLLCLITLGIYSPWFITNLLKYFTENSSATSPGGQGYALEYNGTGGGLFVTFLVGYLLSIITLGIYVPWFMCKVSRFVLDNTSIMQGSAQAGTLAFTGAGGDLFVTFIVGYLLSIITLGIYSFWFAVKLMQFYAGSTEVTLAGVTWVGDFDGTGGNFLVINLVGYLLTLITVGIYGAWYCCNVIRFKLEGTTFSARA